MQPTVGRIVHYLSHGSPILEDGSQKYKPECRAAIVTESWIGSDALADQINLAVLNPTGMFFNFSEQDESKTVGGTWHWPET